MHALANVFAMPCAIRGVEGFIRGGTAMRYLRGIAAAAALTVAVAVPAAAATNVSVPGDAGWVSTGVAVTAGQVVPIKAMGFVRTAPVSTFNNPGVSIPASGPAGQTVGQRCGDTEATLPRDVIAQIGHCAVGSAYFGELIGRIGNRTFVIGDASSFVAPKTGVLELAANDFVLTYFDNGGTFTVQVG